MRSIDMQIHIAQPPYTLSKRISAPTEAELRQLITKLAEEWGKNGVWSKWKDGVTDVFYPSHVITSIHPYSKESFWTHEK